MDGSGRRSRRSLPALLGFCAAAALLLSACVDPGDPTSYDDTVEANFTSGCEVAAEADPAIRPVAKRYCVCAYERLVTEIAFEDFRQLDEDVRDDPDNIRDDDEDSTAARLNAIFADCRALHSR